MPDGQLYRPPHPRSVFGPLLGFETATARTQPPALFDTRADAEVLLNEIRRQAESVGVTNWGGQVVCQLCSPFVPVDPAPLFCEHIESWLHQREAGR
jgi:hypothetical protein